MYYGFEIKSDNARRGDTRFLHSFESRAMRDKWLDHEYRRKLAASATYKRVKATAGEAAAFPRDGMNRSRVVRHSTVGGPR